MRKFFLFFAVLMLIACASMQTKRENYVSAHTELTQEQKEAILRGDVIEGMSPDMVRASWGKPENSAKEVRPGKDMIVWFYKIPSDNYMNQYTVRFVNGVVKNVKLANRHRLKRHPKHINHHHYRPLPPPRPR